MSPLTAPADVHAVQQPLNVIRLAAGNLRKRIKPVLREENAQSLEEKLERIERQFDRAAERVAAMNTAGT